MSDPNERKRGEGIRDGLRQGMGVLSAFKEAIEETLNEARERGDFRPERAKEVMRSALDRAQEAAGQARDRLDLVMQRDFDGLVRRVDALARRVADLDGKQEPADVPAPVQDAGPEGPAGGPEPTTSSAGAGPENPGDDPGAPPGTS